MCRQESCSKLTQSLMIVDIIETSSYSIWLSRVSHHKNYIQLRIVVISPCFNCNMTPGFILQLFFSLIFMALCHVDNANYAGTCSLYFESCFNNNSLKLEVGFVLFLVEPLDTRTIIKQIFLYT